MRQRRLAYAWNILEEDVALRQKSGDAELHYLRLASNDAFDIRLQGGDLIERTIDWEWLAGHTVL